jgi:peptide/nickel transport system ATP-binding protein
MMDDIDYIIDIEDLYVNFYTQQGVIKALDGVSLKLRKGETFGLVGETGCGKSVTANSILRLVPIPPGKIEKGHIYFMRPSGSESEQADIRKRIEEIRSSGKAEDDSRLAALNRELEESLARRKLNVQISEMTKDGVSHDDPKFTAAVKELEALDSKYDLLARSMEYMQRIRGKYISMIFQEPMTALNPVFTVGDQISEIVLLHESVALSAKIVKRLDERLDSMAKSKKAKLVPIEKNEYRCSNCGAVTSERTKFCSNCNWHFSATPLSGLTKIRMRAMRLVYQKMADDPDSLMLRISAKTPLLKRYRTLLLAEGRERAEMMLRLVRIPDPDKVVDSYPFELSGGMQQRVMIAMALACNPSMLIADEPTTALDVTIQAQILKLMQELQEDTGTSILLITHNLGVVAEVCDRVGVMYAGTLAEIGDKMEVFMEPLHPYTQGLMNSIPNVTQDTARLITIEGNVPNLIKPPTGCRFHPRCPFAMEVCKERKPPLSEPRKGHYVTCHLYPEAN